MKKTILYTLTAWSMSLAMVACGSRDGGSGGGGSPEAAPAPIRGLEDTAGGISQPADSISQPAGQISDAAKDALIPSPLTPEQIKKMEDEARKYSGSSDDALRIFATAQLNLEQDPNQRLKNLVLANSIQSGRMQIDYNESGAAALTLKIRDQANKVKTITLYGDVDNGTASLRGGGATANVKCMDAGTTCENMLVDLKYNQANGRILFRRTNVNWSAKFPDQNCQTQECEDFYTLAKQTELGTIDPNTTKSAKLETMEVINGKSSFRFILITHASQLITIGGDLLNPRKFELTNLVGDLSQSEEIDRSLQLRTGMQQSLSDVRIVSNNGLGKIDMLVNFRRQNNGVQDHFALTVTRINKPILNK